MFPPKIEWVKPLDGYRLLVKFENTPAKVYDMNPLLKKSPFDVLKDRILFGMVQVDPGGRGISWSDEIDLSEYELWTGARHQT